MPRQSWTGSHYNSARSDAERVLALGIIAIRVGIVAQVTSGAVRGSASSSNPTLYSALAVALVVESLILIVVVWRNKRPKLTPWGYLDLGLAFVALAVMPLALPGELISDVWTWWASSFAINAIGNFGATHAKVAVVGAASGLMSAEYVAVATSYGELSLVRALTESLNYPIFGLGVFSVSMVLRRMASRADSEREMAIRATKEGEMNRSRILVHDASTLLRLLGDPATPATLLPALRNQATQEAALFRAFLSDPVGIHTSTSRFLDSLVYHACAGFPDLPIEFATDLGGDAVLPLEHSAAVSRAVTTVLHNVRRHARASEVVIHADRTPDTWELTIRDDGVGFEPEPENYGFGLRHQVVGELTRLGVQVRIMSSRGLGTTVTLTGPTMEDGSE